MASDPPADRGSGALALAVEGLTVAVLACGVDRPYPASHGCVRMSNPAINFIWAANILPFGTAVWVY